jgi:hypothetical protein
VAFNSGGTTYGSLLLFNTPTVPPPTLSFSPSNGYFPDCVTISVTSSVPTVYYTTNGTTPTTNSAEVPMTNTSSRWVLRRFHSMVQSAAEPERVAGARGQRPNITLVARRFSLHQPHRLSATSVRRSGRHLYIPVVVELQSNTTLESLQFRVEINPNPPRPDFVH